MYQYRFLFSIAAIVLGISTMGMDVGTNTASNLEKHLLSLQARKLEAGLVHDAA